MPYLLNISIGPVQEFIASARRCQDLWYGSHLLSELAKACAKGVSTQSTVGAKAVIFPGGLTDEMLELDSEKNVANKLLVSVDSDRMEDVEAVAAAGEEALNARLHQIRDAVFARIEGKFDRDTAIQQIEDLIEFQWVAVHFSSKDDYRGARKTSERHLTAVKNTKVWGQPPWGASGKRKSSLDGIRESVLDEETLKKFRDDPNELYTLYRVRPAERLCGVGLLKRYGREQDGRFPFHSSGHVAAGLIRHSAENLEGERKDAALKAFKAFVDNAGFRNPVFKGQPRMEKSHDIFGNYDMGLLYENRLEELVPDPSNRAQAQYALRKFLEVLGCGTPNPYYAVLHADGDRMGKAIDTCIRQTQHQEISKALGEFAATVKTIVEDGHAGSLIYSGGDDVLALLPLHQVLPCAKALADAFEGALKGFPVATDKPEITPTLSVGIGISHFLDDMGEALELARQAEKLAKQERNSLAIIWQKRGGGAALQGTGTWDSAFLKNLGTSIATQRGNELSRKLPFELEALAHLLDGNIKPQEREELLNVVRLDAKRILGRKRQSGGGAEIAEDIRKALKARIQEIKQADDLRCLAEELQLAKEFARAYDEAGIQEEGV
jgi:CRISPR-associated protein Cmr2